MTIQALLAAQAADYTAICRAHDIVRAYLLVCDQESEAPASMVLHYIGQDQARQWLEAATWILEFDARPYLNVFRGQTGDDYEDELEG